MKLSDKPPLTQREAARLLGVHRVHLNMVLRGHRVSRRLTLAYNRLLTTPREKHAAKAQ